MAIHIRDVTLRSGQVELEAVGKYLREAKPAPPACVPASLDVEGDDRTMPDFFCWRDSEFIVSNGARAALNELAPGVIDFIDVKLNMAPRMEPAEAYYYINVLTTAQIIDWDCSVVPLTSGWAGAEYRVAKLLDQAVKFKRRRPQDPLLWHELNLDRDHIAPQKSVLLRGNLWEELDRRFPGQLDHDWRWV